MAYLTKDFLAELLKLCLNKKSFLDVVREHLKYQYIPSEAPWIKKILKSILNYYENNGENPTIGIISQQHANDSEVQEYLSKIKRTELPNVDEALTELESYIKNVRFQISFSKQKELFEEGKVEEAISYGAEESEDIVRFSLKKEAGRVVKLFENFQNDVDEKLMKQQSGDFDRDKIPIGIREFDEETHGGVDAGDTLLLIARSGEGKSTFLKYIGVYACRLGYDVLHVQLEGSKQECYDKYTQVWTAQNYSAIKYGNIPSEELEKCNRIAKQMIAKQRDIEIYAFEMFDEASCLDVKNLVLDYEKSNGKVPDLLIIDSIDLLHPGDGLKYGISTEAIKAKKENSAKKLKNLATEFLPMRVATADQADNVKPEQYNDPTWVMTRNNVSGAKNLANSFSYVLTWNRTNTETSNNRGRLHFDKLRNYHPINKTVSIATAYKHGRFYDPVASKELRESPPEEKPKRVKTRKLKTKDE